MLDMNLQHKKREGRPAIKEGEQSIGMTIRITREQREKLRVLGGAKWVRDRIDAVKRFRKAYAQPRLFVDNEKPKEGQDNLI